MIDLTRRAAIAAGLGTGLGTGLAALPAWAETSKLRISYGYSIGYLPLMVMRDQKLIEKHAAALGLGAVAIDWKTQDGGNNINDAMLAGALDIAGTGIPGYLVLRDRTLGRRQEVTGISALDSGALWLNTIDPRLKTLADYTPTDKIAVPGIKTSYAAVVLEMVVAKQFGIANYARLDPNMVGLSHPDAFAAMMSGGSEIKSHMASPPFSYQELKNPAVHRILSTRDVVGNLTILVNMTTLAFAQANPGLMKAFLAAQEEAAAFILHDHTAAATAYGRTSGLSTPLPDLLEMLDDPENGYSVVPDGSLTYTNFLVQAGLLKTQPASWKDLFLSIMHGRAGS